MCSAGVGGLGSVERLISNALQDQYSSLGLRSFIAHVTRN